MPPTGSDPAHEEIEMHAIVTPIRSSSQNRKVGQTSELPPASRTERYAAGKALRGKVPREQHGEWSPPHNRRNPVDLVIESSNGRIPELVPIRYGRMMVSPFTFYRGSANIMAADLATTPKSGIQAQICGDSHLLNFGGFATPERRLIFDVNDFDETLPGPWEWDVKRLAASFIMAARSNGFSKADQRDAAQACAQSYREHMTEYAKMGALDVWYEALDVSKVMASVHDKVSRARLRKRVKKEEKRTVAEHDFPALAGARDGRYVIKDNPPLIYHHQLLDIGESRYNISRAFARYRETLTDDRKVLLDRYQLVDMALKVVGVGSVGTFCAIALLMATNDDPLFLQIKQAGPSVLEPPVGKSAYDNHGQRVVVGQRLMQSASDVFLGWTHGKEGRHFYVRQLRDMKLKPLVEVFNPSTLLDYAGLCGWAVAQGHARSGDPAMIAGYIGKSDVFDNAIMRFSVTYADLAEQDYAAFMDAIRKSQIEVQTEN
jgi:uncharacterized protein (DUF2252 family)